MEEISFKERTKNSIISFAPLYLEYFVNHDYLLCSSAFQIEPYYVISSHRDNFKHLLGVQTPLSPNEFFNKAYDGTLTEDDFNFTKGDIPEKQIKGTVRRKINAFQNIIGIFSDESIVVENFRKNSVVCSVAVGNDLCSLGFTQRNPSYPMSLLNGKMLTDEKSAKMDLVLSRDIGADKFTDIVVGDTDMVLKYIDSIKTVLSDEIISELAIGQFPIN